MHTKFANLRKPFLFVILFAVFGTGYIFLTHASPNAYIPSPVGLSLDDTSTTDAAITWTASTDPNVTGYQILRNGTSVGSTDQYTTNYLDQNLTPGTSYSYTVEAVDSSSYSLPSVTLAVSTGQTSAVRVVSQCGTPSNPTYLGSGNYVLTSNLTETASSYCMYMVNTHTSLDCQGHNITATASNAGGIIMDGASNVLLINCNIDSDGQDINVGGVSNSMVAYNTFNAPGYYDFESDSYVSIEHNSCPNWCDMQVGGTPSSPGGYNYVGFNSIMNPEPQSQVNGVYNQEINVGSDQSHDVVDGNTLVGDATSDAVEGLDDGIIFGEGDDHTMIVNNTISNDFDCGIEAISDNLEGSQSTDDLIANNTISFAYAAGICSYLYTSWVGNTIENNHVTNSSTLFTIGLIQRPPLPSHIYFENNNFIGNTYTDALGVTDGAPQPVYINMTTTLSTTTVYSNNTFTNNSFVYSNEPSIITPTSMVVDGGNNVCDNTPGLNCQSSVPLVAITGPSEGATLSGTTVLTATASASTGNNVSKVVFSIDNNPVATVNGSQSSYSPNWDSTTVSNGAHNLSATVTDSSGLTATASENIYVVNGTGCTANPSPPTTLTDSDTTPLANQIDLSWGAGSAASGCSLVGYYLYRDGATTPTATIPVGTTSYSDTGLSQPIYTYQIASYDNAGHISSLIPTPALSAALAVTDNPPSVGITSPTNHARIHGAIGIDTTATDTNTSGTISSVQMTVNGVSQTLTTAPYNFSLNSLLYKDGTYSVNIKATDNYGNVTNSNLTIIITNGDLNGDGKVDISDLAILAENWGKSGQTYAEGNITGQSTVNISDLSVIAANWGITGL